MFRFIFIALCMLMITDIGEGKKKKTKTIETTECSSGSTLHTLTCDMIRCAFVNQLSGCDSYTPVGKLPAKCKAAILSYFYGPYKCMETKYNESLVADHVIYPDATNLRRRTRQLNRGEREDVGQTDDNSFTYFFQCMIYGNCD